MVQQPRPDQSEMWSDSHGNAPNAELQLRHAISQGMPFEATATAKEAQETEQRPRREGAE